MKLIEVCRDKLQTALDTIQAMTDQREEAVARLDVLIEVLKEVEAGDLIEAQELLFEACLRFGLSCL